MQQNREPVEGRFVFFNIRTPSASSDDCVSQHYTHAEFMALLPLQQYPHSVNQPTKVQTASEHEMVKLHCTYSTIYMLHKLSTGSSSSEKEFEERFHADLNKSSSSVSLSIQDVHVSDSAVYYCALDIINIQF
uniref:Immunoglobulin V-set domain-containing protein n=1 Tax=Cyprinus carpio TaxID=7962 RepID=A0A8C2FBN6_CYPCA